MAAYRAGDYQMSRKCCILRLTPIKTDALDGIRSTLDITNAMSSDMEMVLMMMGSDCFPVWITTVRFIPNPRKITAPCKMYFAVNAMPL